MRILRRTLFYLFLLIYLMACPWVVLYALGYVVRPGAEQGLMRTGLISVSSIPPGGSVYLGNRRYARRTPTMLRNLLPGEYPVKVVLKNHQPWARVVTVEAEKATLLDTILLIPQQRQPVELLAEPIEDLIPVERTRVCLLRTGPMLGDYLVYDWKGGTHSPLLRPEAPLHDARVLSLTTVPGSPSLFLHVEAQDGERFLWIDRVGEEPRLEDLTRLVPERPLWVSWDPANRRHLFVFQRGALTRIDIASQAVYPEFLSEIRGFGLFDKSIYALTASGSLLRTDDEGRNPFVLLDTPWLASLFGQRGLFKIHPIDRKTLVFLGERGELLAGQFPYRFIDRGVVGMGWDRRRVLFWTKEKLGIMEWPAASAEEEVAEPVPELRWAFKRGRHIEQAFWVFEGSHILFRDENRVYLLEVDASGLSEPIELLQVSNDSSILYVEESGRLYFLDRATKRLSTLSILPK